jgi:nucleoside-diphosphate-sugar epimerase
VGVPKIIFYSSISVYGPVDEPTAEDAMTAPTAPYGMSKLLGEQRLSAWARETGQALAVLRPGVIFGPGDDGNFSRLAKAVEQGWFVFPGRKDTRKAAIHVKDVVQLTEWLLREDFTQLTVNAVYGQASTTEEIVDDMRRALAKRSTRSVVVPEGLARLGMSVLGLTESHKPPVERMFHQRRVDKLVESSNIVSQTLPHLDFSFDHSMQTAILDWLSERN